MKTVATLVLAQRPAELVYSNSNNTWPLPVCFFFFFVIVVAWSVFVMYLINQICPYCS